MATQRLRHFPTLVIVGADNAGAAHLHAHLVSHPQCFEPSRQFDEPFSKSPHRTTRQYRSQSPIAWRVRRKLGHVLEAAPSYLATPAALSRLKHVLPKTRLIVLLRDPVVRAFSHYQRAKSHGQEARSFANCVAGELSRDQLPAKAGGWSDPNGKPMLGYVGGGYYGLQLGLLLKLFPRNKVLLMDSATMFQDTSAACQRVFNFLGLDNFDVPPSNLDLRDWYQGAIDPWVAAELREHYRPHDALLTDLVGQQFSWMNVRQQVAATAAAA